MQQLNEGHIKLNLPAIYGEVHAKEYDADLVLFGRDLTDKTFNEIRAILPESVRARVMGYRPLYLHIAHS